MTTTITHPTMLLSNEMLARFEQRARRDDQQNSFSPRTSTSVGQRGSSAHPRRAGESADVSRPRHGDVTHYSMTKPTRAANGVLSIDRSAPSKGQ